MYTQTAYRCSFCHKTGLSKSNIVKHEERCFKNPVTRSCATCANLSSAKGFYMSVFSIEDRLVKCLVGIVFDKKQGEDIPVEKSLKLKTECGKWVEIPEEMEELIIYQTNVFDKILSRKPKTSTPEFDLNEDIPF